jgi:DUF4097 and DUF4098 domain-containing protein YvlB
LTKYKLRVINIVKEIAMNEERMAILNMIAQGNLTPEEGEKLLRALDEGDAKTQSRKKTSHGVPDPENPPGPEGFEGNRFSGSQGKDWERGFEQFMEGFGRKIEQFAENFGDEFGDKAEMMAQDLASNLEGIFESDKTMMFPGIAEWGIESGFKGEPLDFSEGTIDMADVKGLILFASAGKGEFRSGVDFNVKSGTGNECHFNEESLLSAEKSNGWILLSFLHDGDVTVPEGLAKLGVISSRGDINVNVPGTELNLKTFLGDISGKSIGRELKALSMKGDIDLDFSPDYKESADVNSMKGDISCTVLLPQDLGFTAKTMKGNLDASGSEVKLKGHFQRPANHFLTGTIGQGTAGYLTLNTMKGDISLVTVE